MEPHFNAYILCIILCMQVTVVYKMMSAFFFFEIYVNVSPHSYVREGLCCRPYFILCMLSIFFLLILKCHIFIVGHVLSAICFSCKTIIMNSKLQWEWGEVSLVAMVGMGVGRGREVLQSGDLTKSVDNLWKLPAAYSVQTVVRKHKSQKIFKCMHTTTTLWMWINPKSVNFGGDHKYFTAVHATFSLLKLLAFLVCWLIPVCHKYLSAVHCHYLKTTELKTFVFFSRPSAAYYIHVLWL